jgi:hypothetical protein
MSNRITMAMLEHRLALINRKEGRPERPYSRVEGVFTPHLGCLHLDGAYGGWKVSEMLDQGTRDASQIGYATKRELYTWMEGRLSSTQYEGGNA